MLLSIIIFIVVGFIFYVNNLNKVKEAEIERVTKIPLNSLQIKTFADNCLRKVLDDGVNFVSKQSGYYKPPVLSTNYLGYDVAYFYYSKSNLLPTIEQIESEIALYVYDNLNFCLNNFEFFKRQGLQIEWKIENISVELVDNNIIMKTGLPIKIVFNKVENYISDFTVTINKKLKQFYDISNELVRLQENEPNSVLVGKLTDLALVNNIKYNIVTQGDDVIYALIDEEPFIDDGFEFERKKMPYYFAFAGKYNWSFPDKRPLYLETVPNLTASVGYLFNYKIKANKENVTFFDSTDLFDIDAKTGIIRFIPENHHTGEHLVLVGAQDRDGNTDTKTFVLNIVEGNKKPFIRQINDLTVFVNKQFFYDVNASDPENNTVFYTDNADLFDINTLNGIINFTPKKTGAFQITIMATDINGASDKETFYLYAKYE